jgi:hypothetical protein
MAAGLGFKDFTTGEVLTAADVDGYLMQGVWVFASATARDAAVTSPQEGNFAYLKDTNVTTYYTGSAWANLDTTGMTNPMTTTGDTIYSSSGSTPARLGIGSTGQVLTVAGGVPSWATPAAGGGMTLLDTMSLSGSSVTSATFSSAYKQLVIYVTETYASAGGNTFYARFNADTGTNYAYHEAKIGGSVSVDQAGSTDKIHIGETTADSATLRRFNSIITLMRPSDTGQVYIESRTYCFHAFAKQSLTTAIYDNSAAITSFTFFPDTGTFSAGTIYIYGVN